MGQAIRTTTWPAAKDGQWITPVRRGYRLECCDCGLIHRINFRLVRRGGGKAIQFRAWRTKGAMIRKRAHVERSDRPDQIKDRAEYLVSLAAPTDWFDDPHGPGQSPRCCELRDAIVALVRGMLEAAR